MNIRNRSSVFARLVVGGIAVLLVALAAGGIALAHGPGVGGTRLLTTAGGSTTVPGPTPAVVSGLVPAQDAPSTLGTTTSTSPPTTAVKPTTTVSRTVPPARPTATVRPATTLTTAAPTTTVPPTTIPANEALVTLEGQFTGNVLITFAGRTYNLAPNHDAGPFLIPAGPGTQDTIKVSRADDPNCGMTQTAHFFDPGQKYWVWASFEVGGGPSCPQGVGVAGGGNVPGPVLVVNQNPPAPSLTLTG
jgi:hypothetical protein